MEFPCFFFDCILVFVWPVCRERKKEWVIEREIKIEIEIGIEVEGGDKCYEMG